MKGSSFRAAAFAALVSLSPGALAGETLYATSGPVNPSLLTIDSATGAVLTSVPITGEEALFGGLTFSLDGSSLYSIDGYNDASSDRTFRIDPGSGAGAVVGNTGFNWNFRSVEVHPTTGTFYASRDNELYTIDPVSGAATSVGPISGATLDQATALAIDAFGNAYMTDIGNRGLFALDLATGNLTHLGDLVTPPAFQDLAFDSTGTLWGVGFVTGNLYTIDIAAVTATLQHTTGAFAGIAFERGETGTSFCSGDGSGATCPCGNPGAAGHGCANGSFPAGALLAASGSASVANDTVVFHAESSVPGQPGLFFQGDNAIMGGAGIPFGDGLRCVGGNVIRLEIVTADGGGQATSTVPVAATGHVAPGDVKRYQWWYRDPAGSPCGAGFNLSNGLEIIWAP